MSNADDRLEKGLEMMKKVYGENVTVDAAALEVPFQNIMLKNLFAEIWSREAMSIRDRRLIIIGVIAATADASLIEIQLKSALNLGELERDQLREIPLILTQYIGYPRTVPVMYAVEKILRETAPLPAE
jgi:4-carboxymuconolactone decarboxylase